MTNKMEILRWKSCCCGQIIHVFGLALACFCEQYLMLCQHTGNANIAKRAGQYNDRIHNALPITGLLGRAHCGPRGLQSDRPQKPGKLVVGRVICSRRGTEHGHPRPVAGRGTDGSLRWVAPIKWFWPVMATGSGWTCAWARGGLPGIHHTSAHS
jgi:hypothetical protein